MLNWFARPRSSRPHSARRPRSLPLRLELLEDRVTPATITVTNALDETTTGNGVSLREAILSINQGSNVNSDVVATGTYGTNDTINFAIPGSGVQTIALTSALPRITKPVVINGYSQPGSSPNTLANGDNAKILIVLNGAGAGMTANGLDIGGGSSVVEGLVLNQFGGNSILVEGPGGDTIAGNFVGVDPTGSMALPFATGNAASPFTGIDGIRVDSSSNNVIGGTTPAARNVSSGNFLDGIHIVGSLTAPATGNAVEGNFVGVNAAGTGAVAIRPAGTAAPGTMAGNFLFGIEVSGGNNNIIGGNTATTPGARNVVGLNGAGIEVDDGGQGNLIQGNFSGVGADGVTPVGNVLHGIVLRSTGNLTGALGPAQPNEPGVQNNVVGGTVAGQGNLVEFNGTGGVAVFGNPVSLSGQPNTGNAIEGNSIFENGRSNPSFLLGIDLTNGFVFPKDDGRTPNDSQGHGAPNDPNNFQNFPVLGAATQSGGSTVITGSLSQSISPNTTFRIEFFASNPDPRNGVPEGQTFLGFLNVTTDASGNASFVFTSPTPVLQGQLITATATDPAGNTSEFSDAVVATQTTTTVSPANLAFLNLAFQDLLGRPVDEAGEAVLGSLLDQGVLNRFQATLAIENSAEGLQVEANRLYRTFLRRAANPFELTIGIESLGGGGLGVGATITQYEALILGSQEYFQSQGGGTNAGFLSALARDVQGGSFDATTLATFNQQLTSGTSRAVVAFEALTRTAARTFQVQGYFQQFLNQSGDATTVSNLVTALNQGVSDQLIIAVFVGSQQFATRAQSS